MNTIYFVCCAVAVVGELVLDALLLRRSEGCRVDAAFITAALIVFVASAFAVAVAAFASGAAIATAGTSLASSDASAAAAAAFIGSALAAFFATCAAAVGGSVLDGGSKKSPVLTSFMFYLFLGGSMYLYWLATQII